MSGAAEHPVDWLIWGSTALLFLAMAAALLWNMALRRQLERLRESQRAFRRSHEELTHRAAQRANDLRASNQQLEQQVAKQTATEVLLHEARESLDNIIDSMPSVIISVDPAGHVTHWNDSATRVTGIPTREAIGHLVTDVYPRVTLQEINRAMAEELPQIRENVRLGDAADALYADISVYPLLGEEANGAVIRVDDVTMRMRLENSMIQNEKMSSLGKLAAGTAHEINNPLSTILQNVQNIRRRLSPEMAANHATAHEVGANLEAVDDYLDKRGITALLDAIATDGERASTIVRNMLSFSRQGSQDTSRVDLNTLCHGAVELARVGPDAARSGLEVRIEEHLEPDLPLVKGSPAELQQVLLNLCQNALQAMLANPTAMPGGAVLKVTTRASHGGVEVLVADNGPGMDEATRRRVFEPFFTTKDVGQGTGLGLSISYFIITEHHNGQISVESTPGAGSVFRVWLPRDQPAGMSLA